VAKTERSWEGILTGIKGAWDLGLEESEDVEVLVFANLSESLLFSLSFLVVFGPAQSSSLLYS
jgi:hypothetical protein